MYRITPIAQVYIRFEQIFEGDTLVKYKKLVDFPVGVISVMPQLYPVSFVPETRTSLMASRVLKHFET